MPSQKKNIIVVGYPKSGTHWICRLIAELIQCPILGEWGYFEESKIKREGMERDSQFQCSKSHHTYDEIRSASAAKIHKIVYVVRDPRDIVISGMHYFDFVPLKLRFFVKKLPKGTILYSLAKKILDPFISLKYKKKEMIKAVLYGNSDVNKWCSMSWKDHYVTYLEKNILIVSYEKMLDYPLVECKKIAEHFQLQHTEQELLDSICNQSFASRKLNKHKKEDDKLLRKGGHGYWKNELTKAENKLFLSLLEKDFEHLESGR